MPTTAAETTKLVEGGTGFIADIMKKFKADGGTAATALTNQALKESGPGFWADMARQGGAILTP